MNRFQVATYQVVPSPIGLVRTSRFDESHDRIYDSRGCQLHSKVNNLPVRRK
jgi:hypothetical protein